MMNIVSIYNRFRLRRLKKKHDLCIKKAVYHGRWATHYGQLAYYTDEMQEPLRWGKMQNDANRRRRYEEYYYYVAYRLSAKIATMEAKCRTT